MEEGGLGGKRKGNRGERKIWQGIENNQTYYSHLKNIRIKHIFLQLINGNKFLKKLTFIQQCHTITLIIVLQVGMGGYLKTWQDLESYRREGTPVRNVLF